VEVAGASPYSPPVSIEPESGSHYIGGESQPPFELSHSQKSHGLCQLGTCPQVIVN
jgi:hypothetical protein